MMLQMQRAKIALEHENDRYIASIQFAVGKDFSRDPWCEPEDRHAWLITLQSNRARHFFTGITLDSTFHRALDFLVQARHDKPFKPKEDWESKILDQADMDRFRARVEGKTNKKEEITSVKEWK